jgi:excinuclease UvrABC nuclease subunit
MPIIDATDLAQLDAMLEETPNNPGVFVVFVRDGAPYLARTGLLRRRLLRLLKEREKPSRVLNLRQSVSSVEYWLTGSRLESSMRMYDLARRYFPDDYLDYLHLRSPPYLKILTANEFPRCQVTTHLGRSKSLYYGPFRNRASAEYFENEFLDLFQMRRCQEDLAPSPSHPGCIYGEMGKCLRPCQEAVSRDEYAGEVTRVIDFLRTGGTSLLDSVIASRDRLSAEMEFEQAARLHKRAEKIEEMMRMRDPLARHVDQLHAIVVVPSARSGAAEIAFVHAGCWYGLQELSFDIGEGKPVPLDRRLREIIEAQTWPPSGSRERQERLAILARWFYSGWCDGELFLFEDWNRVPFRKVVNAISRAARGERPVTAETSPAADRPPA